MRYAVISPVMERVDVILEDGTGPIEQYRDYLEVEADTPTKAKVLAVREWRKKKSDWVTQCYENNANPFAGLQVEIEP